MKNMWFWVYVGTVSFSLKDGRTKKRVRHTHMLSSQKDVPWLTLKTLTWATTPMVAKISCNMVSVTLHSRTQKRTSLEKLASFPSTMPRECITVDRDCQRRWHWWGIQRLMVKTFEKGQEERRRCQKQTRQKRMEGLYDSEAFQTPPQTLFLHTMARFNL